MAKEILNYKGLFGEHELAFNRKAIHYEPLEVRTLIYNCEIQEHLHTDLYQLFLITSGGGLLLSSGLKIPLESPCILIIPSNRLHGFVFQSEVKGDVFTIPEDFYEKVIKNHEASLSNLNQMQCFNLDEMSDVFSELLDLKDKVIQELEKSDTASSLSITLLLTLFMINLNRSKSQEEVSTLKSDKSAANYFYQFNKLIKLYGHEKMTVRQYAQKMNISSVHLNRICQIVCQKSALNVIHEYLIQEAKKYLMGTSRSIAEIAFFLGFKDPAHFSKFFKKKEKIAPGSFRKGLG